MKSRKASQIAAPIPIESVQNRIYPVRGVKVMLDRDLAHLYRVKAIAPRQQVKRNAGRFPPDFMFRLSAREAGGLVSQIVIPSSAEAYIEPISYDVPGTISRP